MGGVSMSATIREIEPRDDAAVERLIRDCLIEFGANHAGTAWADPNLGCFSRVYNRPGHRYWVAVADEGGAVVAGVGIGGLPGASGVCELQKMYCVKSVRGSGLAHALIEIALDYARQFYRQCYLETLSNMTAAQKFYERYGFARLQAPLGETGHYACDCLYLKELR